MRAQIHPNSETPPQEMGNHGTLLLPRSRSTWAPAWGGPRVWFELARSETQLSSKLPACGCEHSRKAQYCKSHTRGPEATRGSWTREGRGCSGWPDRDLPAPHALPCAPERLPSCRQPWGLTDVLTLPSHPALLREQMKGEVSSLPR